MDYQVHYEYAMDMLDKLKVPRQVRSGGIMIPLTLAGRLVWKHSKEMGVPIEHIYRRTKAKHKLKVVQPLTPEVKVQEPVEFDSEAHEILDLLCVKA